MKHCPKCNIELADEFRFCKECGCPLADDGGIEPTAHCPACGVVVQREWKFCKACASDLRQLPVQAQTSAEVVSTSLPKPASPPRPETKELPPTRRRIGLLAGVIAAATIAAASAVGWYLWGVSVSIASTPAGATVFVDGVEAGTTPPLGAIAVRHTRHGGHLVQLRLNGYDPWSELVEFGPTEFSKEVNAQLVAATVSISVRSIPPNVAVEIDGRLVGRTDAATGVLTVPGLSRAPHRVILHGADLNEWVRDIAGQTSETISATLVPISAATARLADSQPTAREGGRKAGDLSSADSTILRGTDALGEATLVAYWRFEGNAYDSRRDVEGIAHSVSYGASYGRVNKGASFNGANSYIGSAALDVSYPLTIVCWEKSTAGGGAVISWQNEVQTTGPWFSLDSGWSQNGPSFFRVNWKATNLRDGNWHHIAVTVDASGTVTQYADGNLDYSGRPGVSGRAGQYAIVGAIATNQYFFNGQLDELAVFGRVLTAAEIRNLINGR
ncbi:MAG: PEGA domain-containing protein [Acidobacteria bacterium]|nr:PEGA domain-containing protein [Acidobacteriota bacterium]